jgi:ABC-type multidrug transport system ATPase subunit
MGGSGAGKTTLLDILARKNKAGVVSGDILVNGAYMDYEQYRHIIGYGRVTDFKVRRSGRYFDGYSDSL